VGLIFIGFFVLTLILLAARFDNEAAQGNIESNITATPIPSLSPTPSPIPTKLPLSSEFEIEILEKNGEKILECENCMLAFVDKEYSLASDYAPEVRNLKIPGGGQMTPDAANAMESMYQDALKKGINIYSVSTYRSFAEQESTFEYWVGVEMGRGYSRSEAITRANVYSAKPGHSEHQLGNTIDVSCNGCSAFEDSAGNKIIYEYIEQHAHKFGFVVSYPKNSQQFTGYKYEPWHLRFIGEELALEVYETGYIEGNGNYVAKFLKQKFDQN
jgi:D-alanyl-D-alanine carboxypeptidase